jgi:hypothetical protein
MNNYTKIRNDFMERADLTPAEKLILIYLYGRKRSDGKPWEVNREQIWSALHIGQDTVKSAIAALKAKGYLTPNSEAIRGSDGRMRRPKSTVVESRRGEVVVLATIGGHPPVGESIPNVSAGHTEGDTSPYGGGPTEVENPPTVANGPRLPRSHRRGKTNVGNPPSNEGLSIDNPNGGETWEESIAKFNRERERAVMKDSPKCQRCQGTGHSWTNCTEIVSHDVGTPPAA